MISKMRDPKFKDDRASGARITQQTHLAVTDACASKPDPGEAWHGMAMVPFWTFHRDAGADSESFWQRWKSG
jgi:hypothetical protein